MRVVFHIVALLALAMIVGSIAFFGFGVAGIVFDQSLLGSRTIAGTINATIVGRLNLVTTICAVVATGMLLPLAVKDRTPVLWGSLILAMAAAVIAIFLGTMLFPEIEQLRRSIGDFDRMLMEKEAHRAEFTALHERYSFLVRMEWIAALLALIAMAARLGWAVERGRRLAMKMREERIESKKTSVAESPAEPFDRSTEEAVLEAPAETGAVRSDKSIVESSDESHVEAPIEARVETLHTTVVESPTGSHVESPTETLDNDEQPTTASTNKTDVSSASADASRHV